MEQKSPTRYIGRVGKGWQVRRTNKQNEFTRYFAFADYGGKNGAMAAAKEWRDQQEVDVSKLPQPKGPRQARAAKAPRLPRRTRGGFRLRPWRTRS